MPIYWQRYAQAHFVLPVDSPTLASTCTSTPTGSIGASADKPAHIGGTVKPPKVLTSQEPSFTPVARALHLSGQVQLYFWLLEDGSVSHLAIEKAVGLGLDEAALAAVQKYTFSPAMQNGKPVKVDLYIDVKFEIY